MVVSNVVLKKIIRESCRSLSYNDEERQFSFQLHPDLRKVWMRLRPYLRINCPDFYLDDYNSLLARVQQLNELHNRIEIVSIANRNLLNGEVLELDIVNINYVNKTIRFVKMKDRQYLDVSTGKSLLLADNWNFSVGERLVSVEGADFGKIMHIAILAPTREHIAVSRVFFGSYYLHMVSSSLWPLFDIILEKEYINNPNSLENICRHAGELGIQSWTLLNILEAAL